MVSENSATHTKQGSGEEEVAHAVTEKKGDWESVATRLLALCGGLEQYDDVECVGWCAQERRKNRVNSRSNSLPRTPELVRRPPSLTFSCSIKAAQTLPRSRSQSSDLLSVPTTKRSRSCGEVNIGVSEIATSHEMSKLQIRTTTL